MGEGSLQILVEYAITTTSDWTIFQIVEGGLWSDLKVECIEGSDKLTKEILWNEKTISISKAQYDRSKVVVSVKCTLNILKEYLQSNIAYLISKGDIESTVVEVIVAGKGRHTLVHATKIPNDWRNPVYFNVPAKQYEEALEGEIKARQESEPHVIVSTFNKMFTDVLKKEPTEEDVTAIFEFIRSNGKNAAKFLDAEACRDLALQTQAHLWGFPHLKKKVSSEAAKTLEEIRKRYDELRKSEAKFSLQATGLGGIEKGEKKVTPEE